MYNIDLNFLYMSYKSTGNLDLYTVHYLVKEMSHISSECSIITVFITTSSIHQEKLVYINTGTINKRNNLPMNTFKSNSLMDLYLRGYYWIFDSPRTCVHLLRNAACWIIQQYPYCCSCKPLYKCIVLFQSRKVKYHFVIYA